MIREPQELHRTLKNPDYTNLISLKNTSTFIQHRHLMKRPFSDACITHWLILEDTKLLFLYCLLSGLHLSLSAYKRRKVRQSKGGRKKSTSYSRNGSNIEFKGRLRKLLNTHLTHQESEPLPWPSQQRQHV